MKELCIFGILFLIQFQSAFSQCTFSSRYTGEWHHLFVNGQNSFHVQDISLQRFLIQMRNSVTGSNDFVDEMICVESATIGTMEHVVRKDAMDKLLQCFSMYISQNNLLQLQRTFYLDFEDIDTITPQQCSAKPYTSLYRGIIKSPTNLNGGSCGLPSGKYQVTYQEDPSLPKQCVSVASSRATITPESVTLDSCFTGTNTYARPLTSQLKCVAKVPAVDLGSNPNDGDFLVFAYEDSNNKQRYYCARVREINNVVYISYDYYDENILFCDSVNHAYNSKETGLHTALELIPDPCYDQPCLNGGTCSNTGLVISCQCPPNYFGSRCETFNPCGSSPCKNNGACSNTATGFSCQCTQGFFGPTCESENPCLSNPCLNGGTCTVPSPGVYQCRCPNAFAGTRCEIPNPCSSNPCTNGGTCTNQGSNYICLCLFPYQGVRCQTANPCQSSPCKNGATCTNTGGSSFSCQCTSIWSGSTCEIPNPCGSSPCQNGGTCSNQGGQTYSCQCFNVYSGVNCQIPNPCGSSPCLNGATCTNQGGMVYGCTCTKDYTGTRCESEYKLCDLETQYKGRWFSNYDGRAIGVEDITDDKLELKDLATNAMIASYTCQNTAKVGDNQYEVRMPAGSTTSQCLSMYVSDNQLVQAQRVYNLFQNNINAAECATRNYNNVYRMLIKYPLFLNGGTCELPVGTYHSTYQEDMASPELCVGQRRSTAVVTSESIDLRTCYTGDNSYIRPLKTNLRCVARIDAEKLNSDPNNGDFLILAFTDPEGIIRFYCSRVKTDTVTGFTYISYDHSDPNYLFCNATDSRFDMKSASQFTQITLKPPIPPPCNGAPCQNGGTCQETTTGYMCSCLAGFTGSNCETDINECSSNPCRNGANCLNRVNRYDCVCINGYTGINCEIEPNPCSSMPCRNSGTCNRLSSTSYTCTCRPGFTGTQCQSETLECASNPCLNGARCVEGQLRYTCSCINGYTGINCQTPPACLSNPCLNSGSCQNIANGYICICLPGYTGAMCQSEIMECASGPCMNGGQCREGTNRFDCTCFNGYTGLRCEIPPACLSNPCLNGGRCSGSASGYVCTCSPGYTGARCEIDIQECASNPCQNGGRCNDGINQYSCVCVNEYTGPNCQIPPPPKPCDSNPCLNGGQCEQFPTSYRCRCPADYTGSRCQTFLACSSNPCRNGATCNDFNGLFFCQCTTGWMGTTCSEDTKECISNPCLNGGTCVEGVSRYDCSCRASFGGVNCEIAPPCQSSPCLNGGTCFNAGANSFSCSCTSSFFGRTCERVVACVDSNPCRNGGACRPSNVDRSQAVCTCVNNYAGDRCERRLMDCRGTLCGEHGVCDLKAGSDPAEYICLCNDGYSGTLCDKAPAQFDETLAIVLGTLLPLLFLGLLLGLLLYCCCPRNQAVVKQPPPVVQKEPIYIQQQQEQLPPIIVQSPEKPPPPPIFITQPAPPPPPPVYAALPETRTIIRAPSLPPPSIMPPPAPRPTFIPMPVMPPPMPLPALPAPPRPQLPFRPPIRYDPLPIPPPMERIRLAPPPQAPGLAIVERTRVPESGLYGSMPLIGRGTIPTRMNPRSMRVPRSSFRVRGSPRANRIMRRRPSIF